MSKAPFVTFTGTDGKRYRGELGAALLRDYNLSEKDLPEWQRVMVASEGWACVARSYAVYDVVATSDPDLMQPARVEDIARGLNMKASEVEKALAAALEYWKRYARRLAPPTALAEQPPELEEKDRVALLLRCGFITSDEEEQKAIAKRCLELRIYLDHDQLRTTARDLIKQERQLTAFDELIANEVKKDQPDTREIRAMVATQTNLRAQIESTMDRLGIWDAPDVLSKKRTFALTLSTVLEGVRAYHAEGNRALIDGVFTEGEVEVLLREFDVRRAQYRPDLSLVTVPAAVAGLFDPDYVAPKLPRHAMRRLAKGFRAGLALARQEDGAEVETLDADPGEDGS